MPRRAPTTDAAANWRLLLAIAELAGGVWSQLAREAAERLTRSGRRPSDGVQLLAALKAMLAESGKKEITSEFIVAELRKDPASIWADFNPRRPHFAAPGRISARRSTTSTPFRCTRPSARTSPVKAASSRVPPMHSRDITQRSNHPITSEAGEEAEGIDDQKHEAEDFVDEEDQAEGNTDEDCEEAAVIG